MRRISAHYIFPNNSNPIKNGIIEVDDQGLIKKIIDTRGELIESRNLEFYNGIVVPGFINAHCHLELSHLKNKINQQVGLPGFLDEIINIRKGSSNDEIESIEYFDKLMKHKGIVAVGDISNNNKTITVKKQSDIFYYTFVEIVGLGENAEEIFEKHQLLYNEFQENGLNASIVPHSAYSVSKDLFIKIKEFADNSGAVISMHNQESLEENKMYMNKTGGIVETFNHLGIKLDNWIPTGKNSVASVIEWLPQKNNIIFVHNIYSTKEDLDLIRQNIPNAYWCLCPLSNIYIENKLPEIGIFNQFDDHIVFGTDSLASNSTLSVLDEMKEIVKHYPAIKFEKLLKWATLNGAKALQIDDKFGSLQVGKSPGVNLIENFDFQKMQISEKSEVKVLI